VETVPECQGARVPGCFSAKVLSARVLSRQSVLYARRQRLTAAVANYCEASPETGEHVQVWLRSLVAERTFFWLNQFRRLRA